MHVHRAGPPNRRAWATAAFVLAAIVPVAAGAQSLRVSGLTGPPVVFDGEAIKAMPHRTVTAAIHGLTGAYGGVPLTLVLARVNAPQGEALRGPAMGDVVVVKACDGYHVVLTLPDIDPAFRDQSVILADTVDGHALNAHDGPFRLIVEGDKRAGRSVRCVTSIAVEAAP
jgi:DMSO/TMAO reductase YedYZ molybdopterin-dependent catalytic subunit